MEWIRGWLLGVTAAALAVALADSLAPEGAVKKVGKLAGGLLMAAAILRPVAGLDYTVLAGAMSRYQISVEGYGEALEVENERLMKLIIEERTGAYIQDKAAELGMTCTAQVNCKAGEDGVLYPASVTVYGELTREQQAALGRVIEGNLAIPTENQQYERTKEP